MNTRSDSSAPVPAAEARPSPSPEAPGRTTRKAAARAGGVTTVTAGRSWPARRLTRDAGMNTAEYAVGTLAAVAFAGLLLKVLTSSRVQAALTAVIDRALG